MASFSVRAFLLASLVVGGCATIGSSEGSDVCPEYRALRCMGGPPECSMDRERACRICSCLKASGGNNPVPPDRRVPGP